MKGVPAAAIVTDFFVPTGHAMAETWGVPHYQFLATPHPIANLTEEELTQRALKIAPQVAKLLLSQNVTV